MKEYKEVITIVRYEILGTCGRSEGIGTELCIDGDITVDSIMDAVCALHIPRMTHRMTPEVAEIQDWLDVCRDLGVDDGEKPTLALTTLHNANGQMAVQYELIHECNPTRISREVVEQALDLLGIRHGRFVDDYYVDTSVICRVFGLHIDAGYQKIDDIVERLNDARLYNPEQ